jgi:hypothetical protein
VLICVFMEPNLIPGKQKVHIYSGTHSIYNLWFCVSNFTTLYFPIQKHTEYLP